MSRERLSNAFRERYRRRRGERSRPSVRRRCTDRHHPTLPQPDFTGSRIFHRRRSSSSSNDYRAKL